MKIDIIDIIDTEDGGAVVSFQVDREYLYMAFEQYFLQTLKEKIDESFIEAATREIFEKDELPSESDSTKEEGAGDRANINTDLVGSFGYPHER